MSTTARTLLPAALLLLAAVPDARAGVVTPELEDALARLGPNVEIAVIATFADRVQPATFASDPDQRRRRARLIRALRAKAQATQAPVLALLNARGASHARPMWMGNRIAFRARPAVVREVAAREDVATVRLDATFGLPEVAAAPAAQPEWNLSAIHAPELWEAGHTGEGAVVAIVDTGVDHLHPDLATRWRGGGNSWFDPNGEHALPHDSFGHGTQVVGIALGGDAGGTAIGVAPAARWIGVKIFDDDGFATLSVIHQGYQWLLDPDGNPDVDDAPDVVNNSWGLEGTLNSCSAEFAADLATFRVAGISVVFSGGNSGPDRATSYSPANDAASFAVGATNEWSGVADLSSRGPSACTGLPYPGVVAPGVNVWTADLTFGGVFPESYLPVTGTSFAAPHVSGAIALLRSAFPDAPAADLEAALVATALDLDVPGPDDASGAGLIDVAAAHARLSGAGEAPAAADDAAETAEDTPVVIDVLANDSGTGALAVAALVQPAHGTVTSDGVAVTYAPAPNFSGSDAFAYTVSEGGQASAPATVTVTVTPVNDPPTARDDRASTVVGRAVTIRVLANDRDADGRIAPAITIVAAPGSGTAIGGANGTVWYAPGLGFRGTDSLAYTVRDEVGAESNAATVTITVW